MWLVSFSLSPIILIYHHDWLTLLGAGVLGTKKCVLAYGVLASLAWNFGSMTLEGFLVL